MNPCITPLICPVCSYPLNQVEKTLICAHQHTFDMAREGYVNLLLSHKKRPKIQGDSNEMIRARRRFLTQGYYQPVADAVSRLFPASLPEAAAVVDLGCGEGWYVGQFQQQVTQAHLCYFGVDIAKTAVRLAAKRHPSIQFVVADIKGKLPFADHAIRLITNIFAPRHISEFERLLSPGGDLLIVIPQAAHLQPLRQHLGLLQVEAAKRQKILTLLAPSFTQQHSQSVTYSLTLSGEALRDLVWMTPNYWHLTPTQQAQLQQMTRQTVTVAVEILHFRKRN